MGFSFYHKEEKIERERKEKDQEQKKRDAEEKERERRFQEIAEGYNDGVTEIIRYLAWKMGHQHISVNFEIDRGLWAWKHLGKKKSKRSFDTKLSIRLVADNKDLRPTHFRLRLYIELGKDIKPWECYKHTKSVNLQQLADIAVEVAEAVREGGYCIT